jgi:alpha-amylase
MKHHFITFNLLLLLLLLLVACDGGSSSDEEPAVSLTPQATAVTELEAGSQTQPDLPRTVAVHLFEWRWTDIAQECETFLGPMGFAAVQVSPPQEHIVAPGFPWWQRYQPVSYQLESRSGTRAEFAEMVERCNAAGVGIYVDAVINHMSGSDGGVGSGGSSFTHYDYPGLYSPNDFHNCDRNPHDDIQNYGDAWEVQTCELSNLADLDTSSEYVRGRIAEYLNDLVSLGVAGFRIDAAKHINSDDLQTILSQVEGDPYIYQEVIDQGGEPITTDQYFQNGDVTEFRYSVNLGRIFHSGRLVELQHFGEGWDFMPSDKAIVFTDNHDNQRGHGGGGGVVTHQDGHLYDLANVFMLAWPYGYPKLMSSYAFDQSDQGPPSDGEGHTLSIYEDGEPNCFEEWVCEHRWRPIANMVAFRNLTAGNFYVSDWWSNGNNQIAFGRGNAGFVVINREDDELHQLFQTSMAAGTYCNVIEGELTADGRACTGPTIAVDGNGQAEIGLPGMSAAAIHIGARVDDGTVAAGTLPVTFQVEAETEPGENIYVVGSIEALGSWDPAAAVPLSPHHYPLWQVTVYLPAGTTIEYKYVRLDAAGNITWESDPNRVLETPTILTATTADEWR